jgi:hypothetical protein
MFTSQMSPAEIDKELSAIDWEIYTIERDIATQEKYRDNTVKTIADIESGKRYGRVADQEKTIARINATIESLENDLAEAEAKAEPFNAEWIKRGGWTRAFIVKNSNGHIHKSQMCSTCFPTTQFGWLYEVSGDSEESIVAKAGEMACTVCYPSAPVDILKRKSQFEEPDKKAARIARELRKAEIAAKRDAKSLTDIDGNALKIPTFTDYRGNVHYDYLDTVFKAQQYVTDHFSIHTTEQSPNVTRVITALAHKRAQTFTEALAELKGKAIAKSKRR